MYGLLGSSITYRIATGPREGALGYKLERLARYVTRPPVATGRLALTGGARAVAERSEAVAIDRQQGMFWAQRLKRVFAIDIPQCTFS